MEKALIAAVKILSFAAVILLIGARVGGNLLAMLGGGLAICLAVFLGWLADRIRRAENQKNPITAVEATIVSHRTAEERVGRTNVIRYYITFRPSDGSANVEFQVSEIDFDDFDVGETGPLRYRGWEFLSFNAPDRSNMKPIAPLPEEYDPAPDEITVEVDWEGAQAKWVAFKDTAQALWQKLTTRPKAVSEVVQQPAEEKDDGVLTHELDE